MMATTDIGFTQIPYVRKDDTFKEWRERTNLMIQQQNNFVAMQEFDMLGVSDSYVKTSMQLNYLDSSTD
jgi:hypothetical protein